MKFIPLSFLKACFYWNFRKTWFLLKMYCNECWKPLSQKLLLEVSLFKFHFVATLQYLDRYYNKYPVKQTALLYLKLPSSNLHFLMCFCYFWKDKPLPILTLFRMGIFGAVHGWGRAKKAPSLKSVTHILQWWNLAQIYLAQRRSKNIWITWHTSWVLLTPAFFHWKSANLAISRIYYFIYHNFSLF